MRFSIFLLFLLCGSTNTFANCWAESLVEKSKSYYQIQATPEMQNGSKIMVFVSTSMPKSALKQWARQAEKLGASLCLRGFVKNSLKQTIQKTKQIFGEEMPYGFEIHPEAFRNFGIRSVPAVVLITKTFEQQTHTPERIPEFDVVYGNVGFEEALCLLEKQGSQAGKVLATQLLEVYRGG